MSKVARLLVKLKMYDQAADAIRREIGLNQVTESYGAIGRLAVALVLVQLARDDYVAAEKAFKEWGNCCDVQEVQTLEMLLQAYDDEDPDAARHALASPFIRHMDVEYSCLARDLQLPKGMATAPKANVIENAAPQYKSPNATKDHHHLSKEVSVNDGVTEGCYLISLIDFRLKILTRQALQLQFLRRLRTMMRTRVCARKRDRENSICPGECTYGKVVISN